MREQRGRVKKLHAVGFAHALVDRFSGSGPWVFRLEGGIRRRAG